MSRPRTFVVVAVLAALVVALVWRLAIVDSRDPAARSAAQSSEPPAWGPPLALDSPVESVEERTARSAAPSEVQVSGTVRIATPNGPEGEHLEGTLTYSFGLESESGGARETHTTQVAESSWRIVSHDGATLHWRSALIGGRRYSIEPTSTVVTANEPVRLLLQPPRALKLHVVDAQTGEQLDGIELHRAKGTTSAVYAAPQENTVLLGEGLASPIALTPAVGVELLLVRRAGYAWSHAVVDHRESVDRCVALHAVCEARVRVDGPLPPGDVPVVIEYFDGEPSDENRAMPPGQALVRTVHTKQLPAWVTFELPPGRWRARLGSSEDKRYDGVHAFFETLPGAATNVVLDGRNIETPREPSTPEPSVSFEVELLSDDLAALGEFAHLVSDPRAAGARVRLNAAFVEARPNAPNGPCVVVAFDDVPPGFYSLVLAKTQWSTPIVVGADGVDTKVARVPALIPASFTFHDSLTGKPLEITALLWSATGFGATPTPAVRLPGDHAWRVDSHADEFDFILFVAGGAAPLEATARVAARSQVTRVDVESGANLTVALRDATASVFARHAWWQAIEIVDERGVRVKVAPSVEANIPFARQAEYRLPRAGRFTVRLPPLSSHQDAPPQVVELASGAVQRLEFQLTALGCR